MKTRKHIFINHSVVETVNERIEDFNDYLLCFKSAEKESKDKMYYWCSNKDYKSTQYVLEFFIAGPCVNGNIQTLTFENTTNIKEHKEEFTFEETKEK